MISNIVMEGFMKSQFGEFIRTKRTEKKMTLRKFASELGIVPAYMSDIEKGRRNPPDRDKLEKIAEILQLSEEDKSTMYDLAAKEKEIGTTQDTLVSQDISDYIMDEDIVRVALRVAKHNKSSKEQWEKAIEILQGKKDD